MEDVSGHGEATHAGQIDPAGVQQVPSTQQQAAAAQQQAGPLSPEQQQLLARKDEQIEVLQIKLEHYRSWLSSLQGKMQHKDPTILKNARRLYIGGIPDSARESELRQFFDAIMTNTGASCGPGSSILSCKISSDKSYAFLEMRSVEEASNAMALDGVVFKDTNLKIRRPSNWNAAEAIALGPVTPDPTIDTTGLPMCKTVVEDTWNKIFIGGLPCHYTDEQVKELLSPYGALKSFNLVMDKNTGKSKGYAFCEFVDPRSIAEVISRLHTQTLERKVLTVKRALEGPRQSGTGRMSVGTPLGGQDSGPFLGPSSSGSSRGGSMPPPPPGAMSGPGMRSGSYSSGSQHQMPRLSGRGGSGSVSPMHPMGGGGHRYSPHHPHMGSPGAGRDPFGPHPMMGAHLGSYPPMGFYVAGDTGTPGAMFGPGMMGPPPGPLHGWPTHGMLGPGPSGGRMMRQQQQQQLSSAGSGGSWGGQSQKGGSSYMAGGGSGSSSQGGPYQRAVPRGPPEGVPQTSQTPGTPSPVPPTPGAAAESTHSATTLSPGIGGGAVTAAAALAGAASSGSEAMAVPRNDSSGTGSSSLYQHISSIGSSGVRQRPSDAGSAADAGTQ